MLWSSAGASSAVRRPATAAETGTIIATIAASMRSVAAYPHDEMKYCPMGTSSICPDDPPALTSPRYMLRFLDGTARLTTAKRMGKPVPLMATPVRKPVLKVISNGVAAPAIK